MSQLESSSLLDAQPDNESLNPNATVPVTYTIESGESITGDFTFVGREWAYKDVKHGEGILTDHPEIVTDFLAHGVVCLGNHVPEKEDLVVRLLTTNITNDPAKPRNDSQDGHISAIVLHPDRTFTLVNDQKVTVGPFTIDPLQTHIEGDSSVISTQLRRQFGEVLETAITRYDHSAVVERDTVLQERLASIGLVVGEATAKTNSGRDSITLPTAQRLSDDFTRLAQEDGESEIYYPRLRLAPGGEFNGSIFIEAFAEVDEDGLGEYPVAIDELGYYGHDIAAEHLVTLMARGSGRPTMQVLSCFAAVVKGSQTIDLPDGSWEGRLNTLSGSKKDDRAAVIIDRFTQELNSVVDDTANPDKWQKSYDGYKINGLIKTLREANQLDRLDVVKFMLESGMVKTTDEITELNMLQALDTMGRNAIQEDEQEAIAA